MGMYYPPMRSDELYHWGIKKGEEAKKHKYFARIITGVNKGQNVYRYFYDKKEWDAYVANQRKNLQQRQQQPLDQKSGDIKATHEGGNTNTTSEPRREPSILSRILFGVLGSKIIEKGKEIVSNLLNNDHKITVDDETYIAPTKTEDEGPQPKTGDPATDHPEGEQQHKYIARVQLADGSYRYFYDEKELAAYYENRGSRDEVRMMEEFKLKDHIASEEEDMTEVNESLRETRDGSGEYENNCYSCTAAYEMRRRGYDVEAIADHTSNPNYEGYDPSAGDEWNSFRDSNRLQDQGATIRDQMQFYKDVSDNDVIGNGQRANGYDMANAFKYYTEKLPEGARGDLNVQWKFGGGHSMVWEVTDGEVVIRDCQHNVTYKGADQIGALFSYTKCNDLDPSDYTYAVSWFRTDDKQINYQTMRQVVRSN